MMMSLVLGLLFSVIVSGLPSQPYIAGGHWTDIWASMPQLTEPANLPPAPYNQTGSVFVGATVRQTIKASIAARQLRFRISNAFGGTDLPITAVTVALPSNQTAGISTINPRTVKKLTFSGSDSITVPNGALAVSDPIDFPVKGQSILTISIYLERGQLGNAITSHPGSRTTSWWSFGNEVSKADLTITDPNTQSAAHWYFISAVEAWVPANVRTFAIIGDSITDGRGSTNNANNRWPDLVLAKMQNNPFTSSIAVINQAAGGNRILADGLGPNAWSRIDRDVLAQSGVKYTMIFEGVNDLGTAEATTEAQQAVADRVIQAYKQMIIRIHTFGIPVFGATITPFMAPSNVTFQPYSHPTREAARQKVNRWIRTSGAFDAVIDFDKILRDPAIPQQLNPMYDSGDYLHPNVAGYTELGNQFPLDVFRRFAGGVSGWN
ncbi:extracellular GDSL-like lipase/acylhydrolase [Patellaria atrata CBS 101060]|uniref:Extracellular GDSL-like lipase/acylhydrolase n=1 Tax=Patellaria atrata CBS 101060 TaxID=1346257 RepID=A0A9P4S4E6_9PEZI|nr:extracellular GDSL-like lipase/acylhydrolase [Patellaria atrata CBS 101060]